MKLSAFLAGAIALAFASLTAPAPAIGQAKVSNLPVRVGATVIAIGDEDALAATVSRTNPLPTDTVVKAAAVDRGAIVGTTAITLIPTNAARRGFAVQVQSASATCYLSGQGAATPDYHSLQVAAGTYYETPPTHVGTAAISVICSAAATPVYAREW